MRSPLSACLLTVCVFVGCVKHNTQEDSMTSGTSAVAVADEYVSIVKTEAEKFSDVYPDAHLTIRGTTTREAIVSLLNEEIRTVFVDRSLNTEERSVAQAAGLNIVETVVGFDALAVVVHPANRLTQLSKAAVGAIVRGETVRWENVPGAQLTGAIELVLTGRNSGTYELMKRQFFPTDRELAVTNRSVSGTASVEYVGSHPMAISFVPLTVHPLTAPAVRVVAVEADSGWTESAFVLPVQMEVYRKSYPFRYDIVLMNAEKRPVVGAGFSAFVLTTAGQRIVQNAGLVPAHVPYHAIQLTSE